MFFTTPPQGSHVIKKSRTEPQLANIVPFLACGRPARCPARPRGILGIRAEGNGSGQVLGCFFLQLSALTAPRTPPTARPKNRRVREKALASRAIEGHSMGYLPAETPPDSKGRRQKPNTCMCRQVYVYRYMHVAVCNSRRATFY